MERAISPDAVAEGPEAASGSLVNLDEAVVLKACNVFSMTRRDGTLPAGVEHPLGVWMNDCRFVASHEICIGGVRPRLLVAAPNEGTIGTHELTNPALRLPDGRALPLQALRVRLERRLGEDGTMDETIMVRSYEREPVTLDLEVSLAADFAPMLTVRGIASPGPLGAVMPEPSAAGLRFSRSGRDGVTRSTTVTTAPLAQVELGPEARLRFPLSLVPGAEEIIRLRYLLHESPDAPPPPRPPGPPSADPHAGEAWLKGLTKVTSDDELFNRLLRRSLLDMRMLRSSMGGSSYYAAGVPWFATLFGRDSLITAIEMLSFDPSMGEGTLRLLASMLGRRHDPEHEEDPGKVLHELRSGEIAALGLTPLTRYYGTVDATPLFLCLLCEHADWTGSLDLFKELRDEVDAMLGWIDGAGDRDGDGLLDYQAGSPLGLRNQGWKDSDDGIQDEFAVPLEPPITLVEPQAYALRAKSKLARLFDEIGERDRGTQLRAESDALRARLDTFWLPEHGHYSMGFGEDRRPSHALASNQGHLLWGFSVPYERARLVRDALMSERMFSGWGIRTLATDEAGFNPVGYHTGSVWPHDTAMAAVGLRAYGFDEDFLAIFEGLVEAAATADEYRLPELFAGFSRAQFETTVPYPVACRPQAWAAGALPYLLKSGLGLIPDAMQSRLRIRRPTLPRWVNRVDVRDLRVADSSIDLTFERVSGGDHVVLADATIRGDVEVVLEISSNRFR